MSKGSRGGQRTITALFQDLTQKHWWEYRKFGDEELLNIDVFLKEASKDLHLTHDIYENLKTIYKILGLHYHPFIDTPLKKTLSPEALATIQQAIATWEANSTKKGAPPMEKPEIPECELLQISNMRIDAVTLKLIAYCWGYSKLSSLKLVRNSLEPKIEEQLIDMVSEPNFKLNKLFLDWNTPNNFQLFPKILNNQHIQVLSLRTCNITDAAVETLANVLKDNTSLKCIDLYGNLITAEGIKHFAGLIESSCCLESIGLAKNHLGKWNDVKDWLDNIGRFPMTPEEAEEHKVKEKEKEANIQKNLKNKGKKGYVEEIIPFLYPIIQTPEGAWFMVKGGKIKLINLALNGFDSESLTEFDKFLARQDDEFSLIFNDNPYDKKDIEVLKQKYQVKLYA